jgi:hypothetical protein
LTPAIFILRVLMSAIHVESRIVPKVPRCTMDMLNQNFYFKTKRAVAQIKTH